MLRLRVVRIFARQTLISAFIANPHTCQLNHRIHNLIDASPTIQYRLELLAASLEDDPRKAPAVVADRRALLERYHSRWDKLQGDKREIIVLPTHTKRILEGDILGCIVESGGGKFDVHFIQLPSVSREVRLKQWVVLELPKCDAALKINPDADLLVVPEVVEEGRYAACSVDNLHGGDTSLSVFWIHTLQLSDGFPHPLAPIEHPMLFLDHDSGKTISSLNILVSRYRLVAVAGLQGTFHSGRYNVLVVWDWRSGQRVLVIVLTSTSKQY